VNAKFLEHLRFLPPPVVLAARHGVAVSALPATLSASSFSFSSSSFIIIIIIFFFFITDCNLVPRMTRLHHARCSSEGLLTHYVGTVFPSLAPLFETAAKKYVSLPS